jgi:hypothetical protein
MRKHCLLARAMSTDMQDYPQKGVRRFWPNVRRILLLGHLAGAQERDARWRDWAATHHQANESADSNGPGATLGEAATLLAASAAVYLLIAILIGVLTRSA